MGLLAAPPRGQLLTQRGIAFSAVAAIHVVAVLLLLQGQVRSDPEPQEQAIRVVFVQPEVVRDAPPPRPLVEPPPVRMVIPEVAIQIAHAPPTAITVAIEPAPPPPPVVRQQAQGDQPVLVDIEEVDVLREPQPRYPRAAQQARLQGRVLLWVQIDTEGRPREVRVHRSSGHEQLDREGRDALLGALFKPYRRDGQPYKASFIFPVDFVLSVRTASRN
jgi:protein TonB